MIPDEQRRRMRLGVRNAVARAGRTVRGATRPALMTLLCAGALAPVVAAAVGPGLVIAASFGVAGGMAANILSNVISSAMEQLGRSSQGVLSPEKVEQELAVRIEAILTGETEQAAQLRHEIAEFLREIGAVQQAVEAAVETGNEDAQAALVAAFGDLANQFTEFRFVLTDIRATADQLQQESYRQNAERRVDRDRSRQQAVQLQLIHELVSAIERNTRNREADSVATVGGRWGDMPPYRGLAPFLENEAEVFYGRDGLTSELITRVGQCAFDLGLLVVTGPSGAGKSSLLRAGLFPAIARGVLPVAGSGHWPRLAMTPGSAPLTELAAHLAAISGVDAASVRRALVDDPTTASSLARQAVLTHAATLPLEERGAASVNGRLIVVVDQFEELFTLTQPEDEADRERRAFVAALRAMSEAGGDGKTLPAPVILAVRGDFFDRCASYPEFVDSLRDGPFLVGPMTEGELRQTIIGPAAASGLELEDGLADAILADLRNTPVDKDFSVGALPLLAQTMLLTWQRREGNRLTHRGYSQTGGVANVVETSAEEVYEALTPTQQRIARSMFRRLTTVTRDGQLARCPVQRADLCNAAVGDHHTQLGNADTVLEAFTGKRLVVASESHVEIAHDSVLRAWPRLRRWLEDDRAGRVLYGQLIEDAHEWQDNDRNPSFLYRGARRDAVEQARIIWNVDRDRYPALDETAEEFLHHGRRADSRAARVRMMVSATLTSLLVMALVAVGIAIRANRTANQQHALAVSRQLVAQSQVLVGSDPQRARLLAAAARRIAPQASYTWTGMMKPLTDPLRWVFPAASAVAFSPDGALLATAANDGLIQLWDVATGKSVATLDVGEAVLSVAFGRDGTLASGDESGAVTLWDSAMHKKLATLRGHTDEVYAMEYSQDGRVLITVAGEILVWDSVRRRRVGNLDATLDSFQIRAFAYGRDGVIPPRGSYASSFPLWRTVTYKRSSILVIGSESYAMGRGLEVLDLNTAATTAVTVGSDDTVRVWNTKTNKHIAILSGQPGQVSAAAFSRDGTLLATGDSNGTVSIWDTSTWQIITTLSGSTNVTALEFSPDGSRLVTNGDTVRVWDNPAGALVVRTSRLGLTRGPGATTGELSSDGSLFAVRRAGNLNLEDLLMSNRRMLRIRKYLWELALSSNGELLAGATRDGVYLWSTIADVKPKLLPRSIHPVRRDQLLAPPNSLMFTGGGRHLAGEWRDYESRKWLLRIWDVRTGVVLKTLTHNPANSWPIALALQGDVVAVMGSSKMQLIDIQTGNVKTQMDVPNTLSRTSIFNPDGNVITMGGSKVR